MSPTPYAAVPGDAPLPPQSSPNRLVATLRTLAALRARVGVACLGAAIWVAMHLTWLALGGTAGRTGVLVADLFLLPGFLVTAVAAWRVSQTSTLRPRTARGWRWLALSYAMLWVANALWDVSDAVGPHAVLKAVGRWLVIGSYVPLLAGLFAFPTAPRRLTQRLALWLDLGTSFVGVALLMWQFVLHPAVEAPVGDPLRFALGHLVPAADCAVLVALVALLFRRVDALGRLPLSLLAAGHLVSIAAGLISTIAQRHGTSAVGGWIDALWAISWLLVFSAPVLHARALRTAPPVCDDTGRRAHARCRAGADPLRFLPLAGVALGSLLLLAVTHRWWGTAAGVEIFGCVIVMALVLARQLVALHGHRLAEGALAESEARYRTLVDDLHEVVFRTDAAGRWTFLNRAWTELTGLDPRDCIGRPFSDYQHPDDRAAAAETLRSVADGHAVETRRERRFLTTKGVRWVHVHVRPLVDADGTFCGTSGTLTDVTDRHELEERLRYQAYHDRLTGLPNRACFMERVEQAMARASRGGVDVAVLFVDLDGFKSVNDGLGHAAGDDLLVEVSLRLLAATRIGDTVARFGGDEFAVLLESPHASDDATTVAERVLEALDAPCQLAGVVTRIGASIGVAQGAGAVEIDELLHRADAAMYEAKREGKGRYVVYDDAVVVR